MFRRRSSVKLMDVAGIRVSVDATWFLVLFALVFFLSGPFRTELRSSDVTAYLTAVVTVLLFFTSLLLHELGHALIARRQGIDVKQIQLYLFGGVTEMPREPATPGEEFKVAIAGPLGTVLFIVICLAVDLALVGPNRMWQATQLNSNIPHLTPALLSLSWLVPMNLLILVFNLVPAYPLDGGRIARALVWKLSGQRERGTRAAARLGQAFALVMVAFSVWLFLDVDRFSGVWLIVLAFMLWQAAHQALRQSKVTEAINQIQISDVMDGDPVTIPATLTVRDALDQFFYRYGAEWLPVVEVDGRFLGIAHRRRTHTAVDAGHGDRLIRALVEPDPQAMEVTVEASLSDVVGREALRQIGALAAIDGAGVLRGVLTLDQVNRALRVALSGQI